MRIEARISVCLTALALAFASERVPARAEPVKLWELPGLNKPESVLPDPAHGIAYVGSMAGDSTAKDGNGFISKISLDGKMLEARWVTGLDAPKGMVLRRGSSDRERDRLFVADIDKLVEIDVIDRKIVARHEAPGAKSLNDVAMDLGFIYVSDMNTNTIWRFDGLELKAWLSDPALNAPNGLLGRSGKIIVASFGQPGEDGSQGRPGRLLEIDVFEKSVREMGGDAAGQLDGLESLGEDNYLVTDWVKGALYRASAAGKAELLLDLNQGSADIGYVAESRTVLIPMMLDNLVAAYRVD